MSVSRPRLGDARLREIAAGDPVEPHEAETLLESPEARARLAERDPSALFGALAALDVEAPALPAIPPRSALASRSGSASRPVWRMALGLAAASIATIVSGTFGM